MKYSLILMFSFLFLSCTSTQTVVKSSVADYFESIKGNDSVLTRFFKLMPKGGDIHHHASGTPYAEEYLAIALRDSLFISPTTYTLVKTPHLFEGVGEINSLLNDKPALKDSIIDQWSVRNYQKRGKKGNEQFFSTFLKFQEAFAGHEAELLSAMCKRAAADNIMYLETIIDVAGIQKGLHELTDQINWDSTKDASYNLSSVYDFYIKNGMNQLAQKNADSLQHIYNQTDKHGVLLRFQAYGLRLSNKHADVFGQLLLGFETAKRSDYLVGVNFVAPEDYESALKNYRLHMKMFGFLKQKYPNVNISLHAGELALGKGDAKADDLKFHIKEAITTGKAKRIGHGVAINFEDDYKSTLELMHKNDIAVELNLESNRVILDVTDESHPIELYIENKVPICIASDDEGVLRTNLIHQYVLLTKYSTTIAYSTIKSMVYNSIQYSFLNEADKASALKRLDAEFLRFENEVR